MLVAGICFMTGAVLTAAAYHLIQLVIGRVVLGFGVGKLHNREANHSPCSAQRIPAAVR